MTAWTLPAAADNRPSFFAHALALTAAHGPGPWPDGGYPLPDDGPPTGLTSSVHDGIRTHHFSFSTNRSAAVQAAGSIAALTTESPEAAALQGLHDFLAEQDALAIADELGDELRNGRVRRSRTREVGRWLAEYGTRRNAVATGIVLIGLTGDERDRELLLLLGALEDLSLYAVVALERTQSDRDWAIFELARRVRAWGRIHAVERLSATTDPEIMAWMLREGFRNNIMDEYLALTAATTGDLAGALRQPEVDSELLDGAGGILTGLSCADGGPAKGMKHYPEAAAVIDRYLTLVRDRPPTLERMHVVLKLNDYLEQDSRCREILTDLDWIATVQQAIEAPDLATFRQAIWPSIKLGLRIHDQVVTWLAQEPHDVHLWSRVKDVAELVELAERLLPLTDLCTGPALCDGFGREYAADRALAYVVDELRKHPGRGWPLLRTALRNRTTRTRYAALHVLKAWPEIPAQAAEVLATAAEAEPDDDVREAMRELLKTL
jgi:hypothetical protein